MIRSLLALALLLLAGCHFPISVEKVYRRGDDLHPPPGKPEPGPVVAAKKNDLVAGLLKPKLAPGAPPDESAGDVRQLGQDFAVALKEARIFKEVKYPLIDEKVDVEIEPVIALGLDKCRGSNALKIFPGIVLPYIDGFGLDYEHRVEIVLHVRDPAKPGVVLDTFRGSSALTAERYPSVLWFLGLHAGLLVHLVIESATTNEELCAQLAAKDAEIAGRQALEWLQREFEPASRKCPNHPDLPGNTGRFCLVDGVSLRYPIFDRVDGKPAVGGER